MQEVKTEYRYESITEYDIDEPKRYDMKFGSTKQLVLMGYEGEKIRVLLASDTLSTIQNDCKVRIDNIRRRIDVGVIYQNGMSGKDAKEAVSIFVWIPAPYIGKIECAADAERVEVRNLTCESIELDMKMAVVRLENVAGTVEINCNLDMEVFCLSTCGEITINQVSASSKIYVPEGTPFTAAAKGIGTDIFYEKDGMQTADFSTPDAENHIELNGLKSSLVICRTTNNRGGL